MRLKLTKEELAEIYPEYPDISLKPGSTEAKAKGCNCPGTQAGTQASYVSQDCPLGHGDRGWGLGPAKPGSPYAQDLRRLRKIGY